MKENDTMTEDKEDEFIIKADDDKKKEGSEFSFMKTLDKLTMDVEKAKRLARRKATLGLTERIYKEDRDASNVFCTKNRRCELHGIRCERPCCNICGLADMHSNITCAAMDNIDRLYNVHEKWGKKDAKKKKNGKSVPKDIPIDTDER